MHPSRLLLAAVALVAFAATFASGPARAAAPKPNVLIILMDALRADVLGPYGYTRRPTTPNLDKLAARGVVWDYTISQNAWTVPCIASLFTAVDPQAHRTLRGPETREANTLSPDHQTVAEQFKAAGYSTSAFVKSTVIGASNGYSQGFDTYQVVGGKHQADQFSAKELNDVAIPWLVAQKSASKPFFTYLHFMDAHSPYKAPEPWYSKYKVGNSKLSGAHVEIDAMIKAGTVPTKDDIERLYGLYDAEIEYFDTELGRLVNALITAGVEQNTIIVVTADHGEAFYEHGQWFHGNLYQENIRIPAIIKGPGLSPGRLKGYTQQIDIAPTLADLAGVTKGAKWTGRSQAAAMRTGTADSGDGVYSEWSEHRTFIEASSGLKLIINDGPVKLYDTKADPKETTNLATSRPADVTRIRARLDARYAAGKKLGESFAAPTATQQYTPEQLEQLRELGYIE